jgi:hypothetical protein
MAVSGSKTLFRRGFEYLQHDALEREWERFRKQVVPARGFRSGERADKKRSPEPQLCQHVLNHRI